MLKAALFHRAVQIEAHLAIASQRETISLWKQERLVIVGRKIPDGCGMTSIRRRQTRHRENSHAQVYERKR